MKGLRRVVIGSTFGGLLGAVAFFAVGGLMPSKSQAQSVDMDIHMTGYESFADKSVYVAGKCHDRGSTDVYLTDYESFADETWYVTDFSSFADIEICLSGDTQKWFEKAN